MTRYHDHISVGGGQTAPSGAEQDAWGRFVENRTAELLDDPAEFDYGTLAKEDAELIAQTHAYEKFGFSLEHFV